MNQDRVLAKVAGAMTPTKPLAVLLLHATYWYDVGPKSSAEFINGLARRLNFSEIFSDTLLPVPLPRFPETAPDFGFACVAEEGTRLSGSGASPAERRASRPPI